tara:strand:- start:483 stop:707 length:225 start_codon:yes stop_codon:yes gene_type:complete
MEVGEEAIDTATFIEDELLLAAPDYPMHGEPGEEPCRIDDEFAPVAEPTESPFAALGDLLSGTDGPMEPRGNSH